MVLVVSSGMLQVAQPPSLAGNPAILIETVKCLACVARGLHLSVADQRSLPVPPLRLFGYFKAIRARHSVVRYTNRSPRLGMAGRRSGDTMFLVGCHVHGQVNENQAHTAKSQACVALQ